MLFLISEFDIQAVDGHEIILVENRDKFRRHRSWYWETMKMKADKGQPDKVLRRMLAESLQENREDKGQA